MVQMNIGNIRYFKEKSYHSLNAYVCFHRKQDYQYDHIFVMLLYSEIFVYYLLMYLKEGSGLSGSVYFKGAYEHGFPSRYGL